jgi:hypothetical protein
MTLDKFRETVYKFKTEQKLTKLQMLLLLEAWRRFHMFSDKTLEKSWVLLETVAVINRAKSGHLFEPLNCNYTPKILHWWVFTEKGLQLMQSFSNVVTWNDNLNSQIFDKNII